MKTAEFLSLLRSQAGLPLRFRLEASLHQVPAGYHLTEVKQVTYSTMDCGAMSHRWHETQFELWAPPVAGSRPGRAPMPADKFLRIIDRVEQTLALDGAAEARIHARLGDHPAALYDVASVVATDGELTVSLTPDRTRCKAAERRLGELTGGCCGLGTTGPGSDPAPAGAGGCGVPAADGQATTACCA